MYVLKAQAWETLGKVGFQIDHGRTDIHTLGLVELRLWSKTSFFDADVLNMKSLSVA